MSCIYWSWILYTHNVRTEFCSCLQMDFVSFIALWLNTSKKQLNERMVVFVEFQNIWSFQSFWQGIYHRAEYWSGSKERKFRKELGPDAALNNPPQWSNPPSTPYLYFPHLLKCCHVMIHQDIDQLIKALRVHWFPKGTQGTRLRLLFLIHLAYFYSFLNMIFLKELCFLYSVLFTHFSKIS